MKRKLMTAIVAMLLLSVIFVGSAYAATVDRTFSPLAVGDYCRTKYAGAMHGFYEASGLRCYRPSGSSLVYLGPADPYLACKYLTNEVVQSAFRGPYDSTVCR